MKSIKDLIYFDYEKAKSLHSQISGGLIHEITRAIENEAGSDSEIGFDIKIVKGKIGNNDKEKIIKTERVEVYHELLDNLEEKLKETKTLKNLNDELSQKSYNEFLTDIPNFTYVKACGWCTFEDYQRFINVMENFNEIQRLVYGSALEKNPEIIALKEQINEKKKTLKNLHNSKELLKLKAIEKNFDNLIEKESQAILLDETFVERVKVFLSTLNPNRLNFRLVPHEIFTDFQLIANLKKQYLVNGDYENIIYTYGSRPNVKLTIFGIITSCPQPIDLRVDPNNEFIGIEDSEMTVEMVYDKVFRNVFSAFEGLEKFFYPTYPKISVSPIAIYREVLIEN